MEQQPEVQIVELFSRIHGVGAETAKKWCVAVCCF
jgi:hypothetical protein